MSKRKVEIIIQPAEGEDDAKVSYEIWELTGYRAYSVAGGDSDLALDAVASTLAAELATLD